VMKVAIVLGVGGNGYSTVLGESAFRRHGVVQKPHHFPDILYIVMKSRLNGYVPYGIIDVHLYSSRKNSTTTKLALAPHLEQQFYVSRCVRYPRHFRNRIKIGHKHKSFKC
jgi:hypothetical protein